MTERPTLDLGSEGVQRLIRLTNQQFDYWHNALADETTEQIPPGHLMHYWFILSELALHGPEFRMNKKDASIPHLAAETVRKHVATAKELGFVETVGAKKGTQYLQLTPAGQRAIARTLTSWVHGFGEIQRNYFRDL
jgi:hypothetical protein